MRMHAAQSSLSDVGGFSSMDELAGCQYQGSHSISSGTLHRANSSQNYSTELNFKVATDFNSHHNADVSETLDYELLHSRPSPS